MKKGWLIAGLMTFAIAGVGVGGAMSYGSDKTLPVGVSIGDLQLGGELPETALKRIEEQVARLESTLVSVNPESLGDGSKSGTDIPSLSFKQLGLKVDAAEALGAIANYRDLPWWERAQVRYRDNFDTSYEIKANWDEEALKQAASEAWGDLVTGQSANASRTITDRDVVVYSEEKLGRRLEVQDLIDQIKGIELAPGMATSDQPRVLQAKVTETAPEITVAKLREDGLDRKLVEFTTSFATSGEGRSHNVTAAAKALNDTLLMPGEIFEYGKIVAKAEEEYGYKEAPVILKGKLTPGIGGGICQVSSTLYNAALLAGLDIVERRNHSLVVSYLPKGLDATFASGYVNFKFRNSTGKQLLIRTVVEDKTVTVKLFGSMPENISYKTETELVKENAPKTVYIADEKISFGKQSVLQKGESGYVVEAFLVKMVDGEFAERKKLSKDTYRTQDTLIAVHPEDPRLQPKGGAASKEPGASKTPGGDKGSGDGEGTGESPEGDENVDFVEPI